MLGRQERFNCRDFQQETRTLEWGLPRISTYDFDNDPRKDSEVRDSIRCFSYAVEFRHTVESSALHELYLYLCYEACEVA